MSNLKYTDISVVAVSASAVGAVVMGTVRVKMVLLHFTEMDLFTNKEHSLIVVSFLEPESKQGRASFCLELSRTQMRCQVYAIVLQINSPLYLAY